MDNEYRYTLSMNGNVRDFYTEEALTASFLEELREIASNNFYNAVLQYLKTDNRAMLAEIITRLYKEAKKNYIDMRDSENQEIQNYKYRIEQLTREVEELKKQAEYLPAQTRGDYGKLKMMKEMYENGHTLSSIASVVKCNKSTVKRKLIKMGVKLREK